ncbi:PREDICTED: cyclin-D4-2-like isoform X1 [Camelina sativa]|uniref:Cyclin-D4-2-like isoform X1 n=2 Tax=Camelina sativa TaxID=90675 RepID=A0ABM0V9S4_CAMSA|nr:PREDICTED: cyclin-D4-2-like isoform X1 [Camelina sativa]
MAEFVEPNLLLSSETINFDDEKKSNFVDTSSIFQMGFPPESEEIILEMIQKERQHSPRDDYLKRLRTGDLDLTVRSQALDWIWKACEELKFGPLCICLAVNYLDRFLSVHDLPSGKAWIVQLLAVACLSLAAKIEETIVPKLIQLQVGDPVFVFEPKSIQRMELLVLSVLRWRLRAVTPCSYIRYFLSKINDYDHEPPTRLLSKSLQVIASTTKGIDFLEYRASEIAAAVALSVSGEHNTSHFDKLSFTSSFFSHLEMERVKKIGEMIERGDGSTSCSQTPNNVVLQPFKTLYSPSLSTSSVSSSLTSLS